MAAPAGAAAEAACVACGAGTYGQGGAACVLCGAGKYTDASVSGATDATVCTDCPAGTSRAVPTDACRQGSCSKGCFIYSADGAVSGGRCDQTAAETVPESEWDDISSANGALLTCGADTAPCSTSKTLLQATPSSVAACVACATGTFSANEGNTASACTLCPTGQYNDAAGQAECIDCPGGRYNEAVAAKEDADALADCLSCVTGKSGPAGATAAESCAACGAGKYPVMPVAGISQPCADCAVGRYKATAATRASDCIACPTGKESPAGSIDAAACVVRVGFGRIVALRPLILFTPDSTVRTYSVPLFLKRQCGRTLGLRCGQVRLRRRGLQQLPSRQGERGRGRYSRSHAPPCTFP
jgi:hypothetical protein